MKAKEAAAVLADAGWQYVRKSKDSHEVWQRPDGRRFTFSMDHRSVDQNIVALVKQQRRRMERPVREVASTAKKPETTTMRFYVGESKTDGRTFAELYLGEDELKHLGGENKALTVKDLGDGRFALEPSKSGEVRARPDGNRWRIRTNRLKGVPATGVTVLPHSLNGSGFILRPFEAEFREIGRPLPQKRVDESSAITTDAAVAKVRADNQTQARVCRTDDVSEKVEPPVHEAKQEPAPPSARAATLDDLKASLEFTREYARALGATLYVDETGELRAKLEIVL